MGAEDVRSICSLVPVEEFVAGVRLGGREAGGGGKGWLWVG